LDKNQFIELTQFGKEGRNLEFKRSTPWASNEFKSKIVKSILAFSNVRDGGAIVIGVERQEDQSYKFVGITTEDLATYVEDEIASVVAEYADPFVKFSMETAIVDEKTFLVIRVSQFDEIPVICKRDGQSNLRRGAIYTRTFRIPESAEVPSQTELREILEMAVDNGIRRYYERQSRIGVKVSATTVVSDEEKFSAQRGDIN